VISFYLKNAAGHKPDSVPAEAGGYHLSVLPVARRINLPTLHRSLTFTRDQAGRLQPMVYVAFQHARFTRYTCYQA